MKKIFAVTAVASAALVLEKKRRRLAAAKTAFPGAFK